MLYLKRFHSIYLGMCLQHNQTCSIRMRRVLRMHLNGMQRAWKYAQKRTISQTLPTAYIIHTHNIYAFHFHVHQFYRFLSCELPFSPCIHFYDLKILSALCCGHRTAVVFGLLYITNTTASVPHICWEKEKEREMGKRQRNVNRVFFFLLSPFFHVSSIVFLFILLVFWKKINRFKRK